MRYGPLARAKPTGVRAEPFWQLPLALLFEFSDFPLDEIALEHAQMLQEEDAVEMVNFVAESPGEEIFAPNFERLALQVLRSHGHKMWADDVAAEPRDREAAFLFAFFTF